MEQPDRLRPATIIAGDIKITHSVFALPFALLAAFMAARPADSTMHWDTFAFQVLFVILAMVSARTIAMISNRLLDRHIDAMNPRTASRAIPSGRLRSEQAIGGIILATACFLLACLGFYWLTGNWWPIALALPVLAWISLYPLAKRFTLLCHAWLGSSLAMSPLAAAIAIDPTALEHQVAIWLLAGMVLAWVTGFDVLYALQDVEVDRVQGLHSMPARLGIQPAVWISRLLHLLAVGLLAWAWYIDPRFHVIFLVAVIMAAALLAWEHVTIARWGVERITLAFFTLNGIVSCVVGLAGITDILLAS